MSPSILLADGNSWLAWELAVATWLSALPASPFFPSTYSAVLELFTRALANLLSSTESFPVLLSIEIPTLEYTPARYVVSEKVLLNLFTRLDSEELSEKKLKASL